MKVRVTKDMPFPAAEQYRRAGWDGSCRNGTDTQVSDMDVVTETKPNVESSMPLNRHMHPPRSRGVNPTKKDR